MKLNGLYRCVSDTSRSAFLFDSLANSRCYQTIFVNVSVLTISLTATSPKMAIEA